MLWGQLASSCGDSWEANNWPYIAIENQPYIFHINPVYSKYIVGFVSLEQHAYHKPHTWGQRINSGHDPFRKS